MMCNKSNIKIGDAEYFHPFSARIGSSQCWNFFRCKVGVDYKSAQDVYCLRCCKKMKSKPEEPIQNSFHTLKLRHRKFEKRSDEVPTPAPKRPRTGFFDALPEFIEEGPPMSSIADTDSTHELDVAIESYRKMPVLPQDADPLGFWRDDSASLLLRPLLPLAASVSAVPATEAAKY
jgi:hypothetical protein